MFSWYLLMIGCAYFVNREISLLNRNRTKSRIALSAWVPISNLQLISKYSSIFCVSTNVTDNVTILYDLSIIVLGCHYNHFLLQYSYTRYLTLFVMVTRVSRNEICNIIKWNSWLPVKDINARIALCGYVIEWLNLLKVVILSRMVVLILKANFWLLRL